MNDNDKKRLVQLREYARKQYEALEGHGSPVAQMKTSDVAVILSTFVKSLDDLLVNYVTFKK